LLLFFFPTLLAFSVLLPLLIAVVLAIKGRINRRIPPDAVSISPTVEEIPMAGTVNQVEADDSGSDDDPSADLVSSLYT
jgi:hypothetical protein